MTRRSLPAWILMVAVLATPAMMPVAANAQPQFTHQDQSRRDVSTRRSDDNRTYGNSNAWSGRSDRTSRYAPTFSHGVSRSHSLRHRVFSSRVFSMWRHNDRRR